jgi:ABC-2 type transport system permease protein
MMRSFRAEMVKLLRRRVLIVTALVTLVFSAGGALVVLASAPSAPSATDAGVGGRGPTGPTLESLARAGGGTEVFTTAVAFAGTFLFVVFVGLVAAEFTRGTVRTMLLRQPGRLRLLAGKMAALLAFAGVALATAEVLTWVAAALLAPTQDLSTSEWMSLQGLGHGLTDYGAVMFWVTGYAVLGMAVGVLVRSVPIALAVGIAWAGPFEHLVQEAWGPASRLFPGLLLEAFVAGGTPDVGALRASLTVAAYVAVAVVVAGTVFARRDVTA